MTPDKVEAALDCLRWHCDMKADRPRVVMPVREALSVLTEALAERERDAGRYCHLFDCAEPFCYRGDVYPNKEAADAVIDAAMKDPAGYELSDAEMDATTDYRGHDPDYDRKETP